MSRRAVGSITAVGKNRWLVQVSAGFYPDGRRRRVTRRVVGSRADAERELAKILNSSNHALARADLTLERYLVDQWLPSKDHLEATTRAAYRDHINQRILPILGAVPLKKLNPLVLDRWMQELRRTSSSEQTLLHAYRILFTALKQARRWQLLEDNPLEAVEPPHPDPPEDIAAITRGGSPDH